jgi:hypothetical protein
MPTAVPELSSFSAPTAALLAEYLGRPGVELGPGDIFDEQSLRLNGRELLHVHGRGTLHILLPRALKDEVVARGEASQHPYSPTSTFVQLHLTDSTDSQRLDTARRLSEAAYALAEQRGPRRRTPGEPDDHADGEEGTH